jgi:hypothetical protein
MKTNDILSSIQSMLQYMEETAYIPEHVVMKALQDPRCLREIAKVIKNGGPHLGRVFGRVEIVGIGANRQLKEKSAAKDMLERAKYETAGWANETALHFYAHPKNQHLLPQQDENGSILEEIVFADTERPGQNKTRSISGLWRGERRGYEYRGNRIWHPFCTDPRHMVFYRTAIPDILVAKSEREAVFDELFSQG